MATGKPLSPAAEKFARFLHQNFACAEGYCAVRGMTLRQFVQRNRRIDWFTWLIGVLHGRAHQKAFIQTIKNIVGEKTWFNEIEGEQHVAALAAARLFIRERNLLQRLPEWIPCSAGNPVRVKLLALEAAALERRYNEAVNRKVAEDSEARTEAYGIIFLLSGTCGFYVIQRPYNADGMLAEIQLSNRYCADVYVKRGSVIIADGRGSRFSALTAPLDELAARLPGWAHDTLEAVRDRDN